MNIPEATQQGLFVLQIRAVLEYAVQSGSFVNYLPLAKSLKIFSANKQIVQALMTLMEEDHKVGRPFICALVVNSTSGLPGKGFFDKAKDLGYQFIDDRLFWKTQCNALGVICK